ncbi:hypothetical protein MYSE111917_17175 [Mycobacterium senriense]|uniref:Uncharacterized protein n=1 Tax=Mycobacterium senriense TaxID=2775496 RepID=A0ABM7SHJ0_9MYCO|nr:hypothetical protein [Mycobacterium senriense]BCZ20528.1 hypothetical protein MTY59_03830 [Mycobacterium senriense]
MPSSTDAGIESSTPADTHPSVEPVGGVQPSRLKQALAWVGIVSGGLFIAAAIFFSGFFLSWWGNGGHHAGPDKMDCCSQMKSGEHTAQGAMTGPANQKTPSGQMGPGSPMTPGPMMPSMTMGPGGMGSGMMGPR